MLIWYFFNLSDLSSSLFLADENSYVLQKYNFIPMTITFQDFKTE